MAEPATESFSASVKVPAWTKPTLEQPGAKEEGLLQQYRDVGAESEKKLGELGAQKEAFGADIDKVMGSMPTTPKLQTIPEFKPRQLDQGEMMGFAGLATALAAMSAKQARGNITTALSGAAGALTGFNTGNLEQSKLDIQNFDTQMKQAVNNNNQMLREYEAVLNDRKATLAQKMQAYSVVAHKYQDEMGIASMKRGDIKFELERLDKIRNANNQAEMKSAGMLATFTAQLARVQGMLEAGAARNRTTIEAANIRTSGGMHLEPEAVEDAAHKYLMTGTMPPNLGRGVQGSAQASQILNRASELARDAGMDAESTTLRQQANKANQMALGQLTKQEQMVGNFEKTAIKNADLAMQLSDKVDRTQVPVLNRWILAGKQNIAGDVDVSNFNAANYTFASEYAKIMSGSMGNTAVTDSARNHAMDIISTAQTPEQYRAKIGLLKTEMKNRMAGFADQRRELMTSMQLPPSQGPEQLSGPRDQSAAPAATPAAQATPAGALPRAVNPTTGAAVIFKDGKWQPEK